MSRRLTDKALHPQHLWHRELAAQYLGLDPEAALDPQSLTEGNAQRFRALWDGWYSGKTFHQEPLYPYLIALTDKIFGPEVRWVFFWQMLLGVCSNILVYLIARHRCASWGPNARPKTAKKPAWPPYLP